MSGRSTRPPKYRHYKPKGLAVVRINGKDHYLGAYGSPESHEKYARLIGERKMTRGPEPAALIAQTTADRLTVSELILAYWTRKVVPYYVKDGRPTSERDNIRQALRFLRKLYGDSLAREFGPLALKVVRQSMIDAGRCRRLINQDVHRIRGMFRWATSEELYPGPALMALKAVEALEKGRGGAIDHPLIRPIEVDAVWATIAKLSPQVAAMVAIQLLTAARPGEVCSLKPCEVDRSNPESWVYRPRHKTEHHDRTRVIVLGPKAREVLTPWLDRDPSAYCFCPAEVVDGIRKPPKPSSKAARPKPGGKYTKDSYRIAIERACDRAFPHPTIRKERGKPLPDDLFAELKSWRKSHRWHPHQLRHTKATEIRRLFDTEAAQVILGHSKPDTTIIYAERDLAKAREVMREIG